MLPGPSVGGVRPTEFAPGRSGRPVVKLEGSGTEVTSGLTAGPTRKTKPRLETRLTTKLCP